MNIYNVARYVVQLPGCFCLASLTFTEESKWQFRNTYNSSSQISFSRSIYNMPLDPLPVTTKFTSMDF